MRGRQQGGFDGPVILGCGALTDEQAVHLHHQDHRDDGQQSTDGGGADTVPDRVAGRHGEADSEKREDQPEQSTGVLQQNHRQLGIA